MVRLAFRDFDEFADSISGVTGRYIPTARSTQEWWIETARVKRLALQRLHLGGAATFAGDGAAGSLALGIPMTDPKAIRIDGHALTDRSFILLRRDQPLTASAQQPVRWLGITIPEDFVATAWGLGDAAHWSASPPGETRLRGDPAMLERARSLVSRLCADDEAVNIVDPVAAVAAEEELLDALAQLLRASAWANDRHVGRPQVSRGRVIARCLELINESESQPLFISDLCRVAQVSERTLRNIFQEYFGAAPMRLLLVRQLREIRSALLAADPAEQTVMKIAARFGIWDFSLFARNYRALYAEAPSQTLRGSRGHQRSDPALTATWIGYASRRFATQPVEEALSTGSRA